MAKPTARPQKLSRDRSTIRRGRATITDVAERAGVSKSLVSLVMRGDRHVSPARREAVVRAAAELGYRPNAMARGLVQQRTRVIGVMVSDLHNPFFADVVAGIQNQAGRAGYKVLLNTGNRDSSQEAEAIEALLQLRVDGLILASPMLENAPIVESSRSVPVVVVGRSVRSPTVDSVTDDDRAGVEAAVEHCVSLGHRRIAHVSGGRGAGAVARRRGYEGAMKRLGLSCHTRVVSGAYTEDGGHRAALKLLEQRPFPTAIIAANDLAAIGALNAIEERGLTVPGDISLVGYDNTSLAGLRHISLTTVHQPRAEMGLLALSALLERIELGRSEPRHAVLPPSLVIRKTTAPPRALR